MKIKSPAASGVLNRAGTESSVLSKTVILVEPLVALAVSLVYSFTMVLAVEIVTFPFIPRCARPGENTTMESSIARIIPLRNSKEPEDAEVGIKIPGVSIEAVIIRVNGIDIDEGNIGNQNASQKQKMTFARLLQMK